MGITQWKGGGVHFCLIFLRMVAGGGAVDNEITLLRRMLQNSVTIYGQELEVHSQMSSSSMDLQIHHFTAKFN